MLEVAVDPIGHQVRLVLAHVREQRASGDIADRVEPWPTGDLHRIVDLDRSARLQADRLHPQIIGQRSASHRDEDPVAGYSLAAAERHLDLAAFATHALRLDTEP